MLWRVEDWRLNDLRQRGNMAGYSKCNKPLRLGLCCTRMCLPQIGNLLLGSKFDSCICIPVCVLLGSEQFWFWDTCVWSIKRFDSCNTSATLFTYFLILRHFTTLLNEPRWFERFQCVINDRLMWTSSLYGVGGCSCSLMTCKYINSQQCIWCDEKAERLTIKLVHSF